MSLSLKQLQQQFLHSCLTEGEPSLADALDDTAMSAAGLMGIYRASTLGNTVSALALTYPVVQQLVGERFFCYSCEQFICQQPPQGGDMDRYGEGFSSFLTAFKPAQSLPYLPDVARLEWLFHQSSLGDDANLLDKNTLSSIPPERLGEVVLLLHPAVTWMESIYPVDAIWAMNQEHTPEGETLDLSQSCGVQLVLARPGLRVQILSVSPAEYVFVETIGRGEPLLPAFEAALQQDESFDMALILTKYMDAGLFKGYRLGR